MRKAPLALAAAAVLGLTAVTAPSPAEAHWRGGGFFPAVAGGLIAGAVIGGLASNAYAYGPGYGYYGGYAPAYYGGYAPAYFTASLITRSFATAAWFARHSPTMAVRGFMVRGFTIAATGIIIVIGEPARQRAADMAALYVT